MGYFQRYIESWTYISLKCSSFTLISTSASPISNVQHSRLPRSPSCRVGLHTVLGVDGIHTQMISTIFQGFVGNLSVTFIHPQVLCMPIVAHIFVRDTPVLAAISAIAI